jgi:hypothetical protein
MLTQGRVATLALGDAVAPDGVEIERRAASSRPAAVAPECNNEISQFAECAVFIIFRAAR